MPTLEYKLRVTAVTFVKALPPLMLIVLTAGIYKIKEAFASELPAEFAATISNVVLLTLPVGVPLTTQVEELIVSPAGQLLAVELPVANLQEVMLAPLVDNKVGVILKATPIVPDCIPEA